MLPVERWTQILCDAVDQTKDRKYRLSLITDGIRAALSETGLDSSEALTEKQLDMLDKLQDAPGYIRDVDFLSIEEKYRLDRATSYLSDDVVERAKRLTVEEFRRRRAKSTDEGEEPQQEVKGSTVKAVFETILDNLKRKQRGSAEDDLFADNERLINAVLKELCSHEALDGATIDGRAARDVLLEDVRTLSPRMVALLAGYGHLSLDKDPAERWLEAAGGTRCDEAGEDSAQAA